MFPPPPRPDNTLILEDILKFVSFRSLVRGLWMGGGRCGQSDETRQEPFVGEEKRERKEGKIKIKDGCPIGSTCHHCHTSDRDSLPRGTIMWHQRWLSGCGAVASSHTPRTGPRVEAMQYGVVAFGGTVGRATRRVGGPQQQKRAATTGGRRGLRGKRHPEREAQKKEPRGTEPWRCKG